MIKFSLTIIITLGLAAAAVWQAREFNFTIAWALTALSSAVIVWGLARVACGKW